MRKKLVNSTIALLITLGVAGLAYAGLHYRQSPLPSPSSQVSLTNKAPSATAVTSLPASAPTDLSIPAINVRSEVTQIGLNPDGTPGIPVGANVDKAAWLTTSVTPGQAGTSVIIGHVDTVKSGPSVFYRLGKLSRGDTIYINRQDNSTAVFTVDSVRVYNKDAFPSATVYGRADSPVLRLLTCAGSWDSRAHQYTQNLVVFASLSGRQ